MAQGELATGFFAGLVLLGLVLVLTARGWQHYSVAVASYGGEAGGGGGGSVGGTLSDWSEDPTVLSAVFVVVALGVGLAAWLFLGGADVQQGTANLAGVALVAAAGVASVAYVFFGTYRAARSWGMVRSTAVLAGSWVLGLLFVVVVLLRLAEFV